MDTIRLIDHYLCIQMPKEVDHHQAMKIRETADKILLEAEVENIVFDFENTQLMDSSGIGVILGRLKKIRGLGGKVYIINASERLMGVLQLAGIMPYLEVLKSESGKGRQG